jgi:hypothetical protein
MKGIKIPPNATEMANSPGFLRIKYLSNILLLPSMYVEVINSNGL